MHGFWIGSKRRAPERIQAFGFWLHSAVWLCYLSRHGTERTWLVRPWYTRKCSPSFADALAALRAAIWSERFSPASGLPPELTKFLGSTIQSLARAG